ncbi:MAG: hypothetical protein HN725_18475 [Alphaproteobacteria bacterium]|nr:hypothetical protein [Alphaproteobacteria bacterium]MBT4542362.1 hypothetical protein [Alphaproteobacteria bacterium]MBT7747279.1 hypothetical protein [Alphaproteobacteria bacterium]
MSKTEILQTKLVPPFLRGKVLVRHRLESHFDRNCPITLISASAGSGKTTLMKQIFACRAAAGETVGWVSLDSLDAVPKRFLVHVLSALDEWPHGEVAELVETSTTEYTCLASWINWLLAHDKPRTLFLDDFHTLESGGALELAVYLLENLPLDLNIVISSRHTKSLPVSRFKARSMIREIGNEDLRFNEDEVRVFMNDVLELNLSVEELGLAVQKTGGWAAGIQLVSLDDRQHRNAEQTGPDKKSPQSDVFRYFAESVFSGLETDLRNFLLETSILDQFTPEICDAVRGETDSRFLITSLVESNFFINCFDETNQLYRYHQLFAEFLQWELARQGKPVSTLLHQRAADWFVRRGMLIEATEHSLKAGDLSRAADLVEKQGADLLNQEDNSMLRRWLDSFPTDVTYRRPYLNTLQAWLQINEMDLAAAEKSLVEAEKSLAELSANGPAMSPDTANLITDVRLLAETLAYLRHGEPEERKINRVGKQYDDDDPLSQGRYLILKAYHQRAGGHLEQSIKTFQQATEANRLAGSFLGTAFSILQLGFVQFLRADYIGAERTFRRGIDYALQENLSDRPIARFLGVALAIPLLERGHLDEAEETLLTSRNGLLAVDARKFLDVAEIEWARLAMARGQTGSARDILEEAKLRLRTNGDWRNWFRGNQLSIRIAIEDGDLLSAENHYEGFERHQAAELLSDTSPLTEMSEIAHVSRLMLLMAQKNYQVLLRHSPMLVRSASDAGRLNALIEIHLHEALAWHGLGSAPKSARCLEKALELAEKCGAILPFLRRDPFLKILLDEEALLGKMGKKELLHIDKILSFSETPNGLQAGIPPQSMRETISPLNNREQQILQLVAQGLRNRAVASRLALSDETVKWHLRNVYRKLNVKNRTQAVARIRDLGVAI